MALEARWRWCSTTSTASSSDALSGPSRSWLSYLQTMAALGYTPLVAITIALQGKAVDCLDQITE